jgi:hypothetical protein
VLPLDLMLGRYVRTAHDIILSDWDWWEYFDIRSDTDGLVRVIGDDCVHEHVFLSLEEALCFCNGQPSCCAVCTVMTS